MATTPRYVKEDDVTHVRKYTSRALGHSPHTTAAREVLDNAVDEVTRGHATEVNLIYHDDGSIEIRDNGRGLDVGYYDDYEQNGIVVALGSSRAGENFNSTLATGGQHGEGAAACNYISLIFEVTVFKNGKQYQQYFHQGRPVTFNDNPFDHPNATPTPAEAQKLKGTKITTPGAPEHGTWIRFLFDPAIAAHDELDVDELNKRARMSTWLTEGMRLTITNEGETEVVDPDTRGTAGVLREAAGLDAIGTVQGSFDYDIKDKKGEVIESKQVEYELSFAPHLDSRPISAVNSIYTLDGGQHADAALKGLGAGAVVKTLRALKRKPAESYPGADDFQNSICVAVAVRYLHPSYAGQDKRKLAESVMFSNRMVKDVTRRVEMWAQSPANAAGLLSWAENALTYARMQQKIHAARSSVKIHSGIASRGSNLSLPDKYTPCKSTGPGSGAELLIGEGASAVGTIKAARDASFQACFELKGKPINVRRMKLSTLRKKEEFVAIEALMNTGIGDNCDTSKRRFDRVIFSCDADVDGYNINSLLSSLFISYYRPYVEEGRVFISIPPLFIVTSSHPDDRIMCVDEKDRDKAVAKLEKLGRSKIEVQRCKGLGEMSAKDFRNTVLDPAKRVLYRVEYESDRDDADLNIVFAETADKRREWMYEMGRSGVVSGDDVME